ncbi:DoxX family membrane protein [Actinomadura sp. 7K507]|uniref:DoxX family membrane protein n=1 Tax=Actinomadura sp. 7K507 TaxID=2530365 RepID=UPI001046F77B|nr:DoxX family membrane protein [Actinomadura sp. 7K507]TDC75060.1 DoxX family membrane protein [Actinomadura sp. 7K507]
MRPFTTLARPFVAAPYIMTGLEAIRDPRERAERVGPAVKPVADRIEWLPKDPETLVRMEGALSLGTGAMLLTGKFRRLTTLLLAAQLVPALATEHRFWSENDLERRASERSHLLKNAGMFGALLMVATEPRRPPRMAELRRAARETQIKSGADAKVLRKEAAATLRDARREAARQVRVARAEGGRKAAKQTAKATKAARAAKPGAAFKAGKAGGAAKAGKAGAQKAGKAGGALKNFKAGSALKAGRAAQPGRAARAGQTVKAGTATQAAKAMKAGKTVKAGTAVQAGKVKQAVQR